VNGSLIGIGVTLGAGVDVDGAGPGVTEGLKVGVNEGGIVEVKVGKGVNVGVIADWITKIGIMPHKTKIKRTNIIIKMRRMDIL
jgi:hypothetical protein